MTRPAARSAYPNEPRAASTAASLRGPCECFPSGKSSCIRQVLAHCLRGFRSRTAGVAMLSIGIGVTAAWIAGARRFGALHGVSRSDGYLTSDALTGVRPYLAAV